jgi:hypothetical protein
MLDILHKVGIKSLSPDADYQACKGAPAPHDLKLDSWE